MENKKTFYLTTPIYYPSGKFHIGTAYCETLANCIKRYKKVIEKGDPLFVRLEKEEEIEYIRNSMKGM